MPDYSKTRIQFRRGTAAEFASANPTLGVGEPAFSSDTNTLKIGDGSTAYSSLSSISGGGGGGGISNVVEDTSPQLGGDLDAQSADISNVDTLTATTLVKSGGTASQFLKANGTVDSNTYLQSDATGISGATAVTNIVYMSQADYNALGSYDSSTIYYIV